MATDESNGAEFQEKTVLKRKLTGPPRLLLGKPRSPGREEKKSTKYKGHDGCDGNEAPTDTAEKEQSSELHKQMTSERPKKILTTELDKGTRVDVQEQCLEINLERKPKKSLKKCKAGMTIRWIFSCGKRKKAVEDNSIQGEDLLTHSVDSLKKKKPVKKIKVQMWSIIKKRSSMAKQEEEEGEDHQARQYDTFTEISEASANQQIPGAAEPPAIEEEQNEFSGIDGDVSKTSEKICVESQEPKLELGNHHHPPESQLDEKEPKIPISEAGLIKANSDQEHHTMCLGDPVTVKVPAFKCKPLITIEDFHLSEEENDTFFVNPAPRYGTLSPLVPFNGSCYTSHSSDRRLSEILLAQTALSLVQAAISCAVEQLSDELQSHQMEDLDHV